MQINSFYKNFELLDFSLAFLFLSLYLPWFLIMVTVTYKNIAGTTHIKKSKIFIFKSFIVYESGERKTSNCVVNHGTQMLI